MLSTRNNRSSARRNSRRWWQDSRARVFVSMLVVAILAVPVAVGQSAMAADEAFDPVTVQLFKDADPSADDRAVNPGETVTFTITANCSSDTTSCIGLKVADTVPAPLVLDTVDASDPARPYDVAISGNSFVVTAKSVLDGGRIGIGDGDGIQFNVKTHLPATADASWDAKTITNTAYATVENRDSNQESSVDVLLAIPTQLSSTITKAWDHDKVFALAGTTTGYSVSATNASNRAVNELWIQDPATVPSNTLDYQKITALDSVVFPSGATAVRVDYYDTAWHVGTDAATAALPSGVDPATIKGLRFRFTSTTEIAKGATASFHVATELTSNVSTIGSTPVSALNTASTYVKFGNATGTTKTASDTLIIAKSNVGPVAEKTFSKASVIGGEDVTATLVGRNGGDFSLRTMTITEPTVGTTSFADQGIAFKNWDQANIEWPVGATSVVVSYHYVGEADAVVLPSSTSVDTLPAPDSTKVVESFSVKFVSSTNSMAAGQYASLPFVATTDAVNAQTVDVTKVNTITVDVETANNLTGSAQASDDLTRRSSRVRTTTTKVISPASIFAAPGMTVLVSLPSTIQARPVGNASGGSTVGARVFTVTDDDVEFWNTFDLKAIVATQVMSGATLNVEYTTDHGTTWLPLTDATNLVGSTTLSLAIPTATKAVLNGVRFVYTPTAGGAAELGPDYTVTPYLRVALRSTARDSSLPFTMPSDTNDNLVIDNKVVATVHNPIADPPTDSDDATDDVTLKYVDGDGLPGIEKVWNKSEVVSGSNDTASVTLNWGTSGNQYSSVRISDTADDISSSNPVANTVYEAFNLVSIDAITPTTDPLITWDDVKSVQLFRGGQWVATANNPCATAANCEGKFPGYTLTAAELLDTQGVRLLVTESTTRAARIGTTNPDAPLVGDGVASTPTLNRKITLQFRLRDDRRSNTAVPVLGVLREATYNTSNYGEVRNDARVDGRDASNVVVHTDTDADEILILDPTIGVSATKVWTDGPLGVPPVGTPQSLYPSAHLVLTGKNLSGTRVDKLAVAEPTSGTNPFDYVNIDDIESITVPSGATANLSTVTFSWETGPNTTVTIAVANAMTATQLAGVTGITVAHSGRIANNATTIITLSTQLREFERGSTTQIVDEDLVDGTVDNTITASVTDDGGSNPRTPTNGPVTVTANASDDIDIESFDYGVVATKVIQTQGIGTDTITSTSSSPAIQYDVADNAAKRNAKVTITGQPTGNVRTTKMVIEDYEAKFWNAYNFSAFNPATDDTANPINTVRADVLLHIVYDYDTVANTVTPLCDVDGDGGNAPVSNLDACWYNGTAAAVLPTNPSLPSGSVLADIRGVRFTYTKTATGTTDLQKWERPFNPVQSVSFTTTRRDTLLVPKTTPATPVPSTLFTFTATAPGETVKGIFTNGAIVTASASVNPNDPSPLWSATDRATAAVRFQHLPAKVKIQKTAYGQYSLGTDIPYTIAVTNTGSTYDKPLGSVVVKDTIPSLNGQPYLVFPIDPDTDETVTPDKAFTYTLKNGTQTNTDIQVDAVVSPSGPTSQLMTFTLVKPATLERGWTLTISTPLQFKPLLATSEHITNTAVVTADQSFETCDWFVNSTNQQTQQTQVADCTTRTETWPLPSAPMSIIKGVRGIEAGPLYDVDGEPLATIPDDMGVMKLGTSSVSCAAPTVSAVGESYYRYPCAPITRPGSTEEWAAKFTNSGNIDVVKLVAIDVLPAVGDTGIILTQARNSQWAPTLTSYPVANGLPAGTDYRVEYIDTPGIATNRCNGADIQDQMGMDANSVPPMVTAYQACLANTSAIDDIPSRDAAWKTLLPSASAATLASVVALRFTADISATTGLHPGAEVTFVYQTKSAKATSRASTSLLSEPIAWNSIAGAAVGADPTNRPYRFVTEPRKAGIALAVGSVQLSKALDDASSFSDSAHQFKVSLDCVSDGEHITLRNAAGVDRNPFTLTAGAAPTTIDGVPLYADCTVNEAAYGATDVDYSPKTITAQLRPEVRSDVADPHPLFNAGTTVNRPAIEASTITNTYTTASLRVSKTVDNGGAKNAAGNPIVYQGFTYSVVCTFNNGVTTNSVRAAGFTTNTMTFALNDGDSRTLTGLPAGAICVVTETNTNNSTTTTRTVTTGTVAATTATSTAATVTLTKDVTAGTPTNTVAYTNTYGVGSLEVKKAITGLGGTAYGTGDFTVNVVCTLPSATPSTVWSGNVVLSVADGLAKTISNIATGKNTNANSRTTCVVNETDNAGATQSTASQNIVLVAATSTPATVTNRYDLASLLVKKVVHSAALDSDGDPVYPGGPFAMVVTCEFEGDSVYADGYSASTPMEFSLEHNEEEKLTGLPAGAECEVTEETPAGESTPAGADSTTVATTTTAATATATGPVATLTLTPDVDGAGTNRAVVNNNYGVTSFSVTKELAGGAADQFGVGPFIVSVYCLAPGGVVAFDDDIELTLTHLSEGIDDLAANTECTITESNFADTGADTVVVVDNTTDEVVDDTITVGETPGGVTITNTYLTGSLTVTKTLAGDAKDLFGNGPFTVHLECARDDQDIVIDGGAERTLDPNVTGGMVANYTLLPSNAECTLTETNDGGATSSLMAQTSDGVVLTTDVATGVAFTVDADAEAQAAITVENTFQLSSIAVTKKVESDAVHEDGSPVVYGPFSVAVSCTFEGESVFADGFDADSPMLRTDLMSDSVWNLEKLPSGAECEIGETDDKDAVSTTVETAVDGAPSIVLDASAATIELATGAVNTALFTNSYEVGSLTLTKEIVGDASERWGDKQVTIRVSCEVDDASGPQVVWDKTYDFKRSSFGAVIATIAVEKIAAGALCTVTEEKTGGATSVALSDGTTVTAGETADFTVTSTNAPAITVTNTFELSSVSVTKERIHAGAELYGAGPFEVTLACTRDIDGTVESIEVPFGATRSLDAAGGYFAEYTELPSGADCAITESKTGGADRSFAVPDTMTLGAAPVDVTVTNEFDTGELAVTKEILGDGSGLWGAGPFEVSLTCTREVNGETVPVEIPGGLTRILSGENGYAATYEQLPARADCALVETKNGGATWTTVSDDSVKIVADDVVTVNVTNMFEIGALQLTKAVLGFTAGDHTGERFEVELGCEAMVDGQLKAVPIPDDPRRTFAAGETVTWDALPAMSDCTVKEVKSGGASLSITSRDGFPLIGARTTVDDEAVALDMANVFNDLPFTGMETVPTILIAVLFILLGLILLLVMRVRRGRAVTDGSSAQ